MTNHCFQSISRVTQVPTSDKRHSREKTSRGGTSYMTDLPWKRGEAGTCPWMGPLTLHSYTGPLLKSGGQRKKQRRWVLWMGVSKALGSYSPTFGPSSVRWRQETHDLLIPHGCHRSKETKYVRTSHTRDSGVTCTAPMLCILQRTLGLARLNITIKVYLFNEYFNSPGLEFSRKHFTSLQWEIWICVAHSWYVARRNCLLKETFCNRFPPINRDAF